MHDWLYLPGPHSCSTASTACSIARGYNGRTVFFGIARLAPTVRMPAAVARSMC